MAEVDYKEEGNKCFKNAQYGKAVSLYTKAIDKDPTNPALYSNRSVAFLKAKKDQKALEDAEKAIELKPTWAKGYYRKASALYSLGRHWQALSAIKEALDMEPNTESVEFLNTVYAELAKDITSDCVHTSQVKPETQPQSQPSTSSEETPKPETQPETPQPSTQGVEYSDERNRQFVQRLLNNIEVLLAVDKFVVPVAQVLTGDASKEPSHMVAVDKAFMSPENNAEFSNWIRGYIVEQDAHAVVVIGRKDLIAFPSVWHMAPGGWKHGDGIFVHVETRTERRIVFIAKPQRSSGKVLAVPQRVELSSEYSLVPALFLR